MAQHVRRAEDVACVRVARHKAQGRPFATTTDEDRHAWLGDRLRAGQDSFGACQATLERTRIALAVPRLMGHLERVLEQPKAVGQLREGDAQRVRLLDVPGGADAEPGAAAGEHVKGGRRLDPKLRARGRGRHRPSVRAAPGVVLAAMKPSAVMPSSIGSSISPTLRIWKRWSMTQIESKPASSAARQMRARVGPMASSPPGQVKDEIWRPTFNVG